MQHRMTEMLRVIDGICHRHGLRYWLCSGTLLGAVRHEGYIPWDDDLDIEMMRPDYDRLMEILPRELPEDMALQTPDTDAGYFFCYAKVRDRRSRLSETNDYDRIFEHRGIFIDIFPYEKMPLPLLWVSNRTFGRIYKVMRHTDWTVETLQPQDPRHLSLQPPFRLPRAARLGTSLPDEKAELQPRHSL